jgi:hypothetical protein
MALIETAAVKNKGENVIHTAQFSGVGENRVLIQYYCRRQTARFIACMVFRILMRSSLTWTCD